MSNLQHQFVLTVALGAFACAQPPPPTPTDAGTGFQNVQLTSPDPGQIALRKGESYTLHAVATDAQSVPVAGVPIKWKGIQAPSWLNPINGALQTDAAGVATATVTMQEAAAPITIRAAIPGEDAQVEWTLCEQVVHLRAEPELPLTATDAPANQQVTGDLPLNADVPLSVSVQAEGCAGSAPLANQTVTFQVYRGVSGTSLMGGSDPGYLEVTTNATGIATATLKPGLTTGMVTVFAVFENAPPVQFDLRMVTVP